MPRRPPTLGRRRFLALAAGGALAACRARRAARPRDTLVIAVRGDVTGFYPNPPIRNEAFTSQVNWNVFEGLVTLDTRLRLGGGLAEHWSSPDDRTYLFDLVPSLRFSDGSPVLASDVATSLLRARQAVYRDYFHAVAQARAIGDRQVEVVTTSPYLVLLTRLPWGMVLPAREWQKPVAAPVGTGPYRLAAWEPGRSIRLEANPYHRAPAPEFKTVIYRVIPDERARVEAVRSGEADMAEQVPLGSLEDMARVPGARVQAGEGMRIMYLALRPGSPPFDDARVREAVDLAIDREEILRRALGRAGSVATQLVPMSVVGFNPELPRPRLDRERARSLLAAAGHSAGFDLDLHGPNNRYVNDVGVLDEIARQLRDVGIRARVVTMDKAAFFPLAASGGTRMHLMGWSCETAEAGDVLEAVAHTQEGSGLGADNDMQLSDPELDRMIASANASASAAERARRLQAAMGRLNSLRVYLPLYVQPEAVLVSERIVWTPPPNFAFVPAAMRLSPGA